MPWPEKPKGRMAERLAAATLILAGHGSSRNPNSSRPTYAHAAAIRAQGLFADVQVAFWKEDPHIRDALAKTHTTEVFVVPNLACKGYITGQLIPREMGLSGPLTTLDDGRRVILCDPVGTHPRIATPITARLKAIVEANRLELSETCVVLVGHGSERSRQSSIQTAMVAGMLADAGVAASVRTAFLEHPPFVKDWTRDCRAANVIVAPFMISNGLHGAEDVPELLGLDPADPALARMAEDGTPAGPFVLKGRKLWYCRAVGAEPEIALIAIAQAMAAAEANS